MQKRLGLSPKEETLLMTAAESIVVPLFLIVLPLLGCFASFSGAGAAVILRQSYYVGPGWP